MAAPNLLSLTTGTGKTAYLTPANTTANVLLANAASSGQVYKINQIVAVDPVHQRHIERHHLHNQLRSPLIIWSSHELAIQRRCHLGHPANNHWR